MNDLIVFGASGRTGKHIVKLALDAGFGVTAFVHKHNYEIENERLNIITGDVHDTPIINAAIAGHRIVISAIGTNEIDGTAVNLMSDGMKIFIDAMQQYGIKRVLAIGGLAILQHNESMQMIEKPDYPALYKNIGEGHNKVYKLLRETDLDWTMMGCPDIVESDGNRKYAVKKDYPVGGKHHIFTGDLADFLVKEMTENKFLKTRVGIANTE